MIKSITYKNFKLLKDVSLSLDKTNIIYGINQDDTENSSNGSGKSSILEGIIFSLYGEGSGKNLADLISLEEKSSEVKIELDKFSVIRKIPTELNIFINGNELAFNTPTLKQNWINEQIGDYKFFQKYRLINRQAINLLDLGITSLRKELMLFIDDVFSSARKNLLNQKLERENKSVDKRLYKFNLSEKRLKNLEEGLKKRTDDLLQSKKSLDEQYNVLGKFKSEIDSKNKLIYYKEQDKKKLNNGFCPILNTKCQTIAEQSVKVNKDKTQEITNLQNEIKQIEINSRSEQEAFDYFKENSNLLEQKKRKTQECIMKLKEAFKFKDYCFTKKDMEIYNNSIKILDEFASWYIFNWLENLELIINDLLQKVNISIKFSPDKSFMTVINEGKEMKYEQLSSGQQCFLNCIFKMSILLQNGINSGLLLFDEGINVLDKINLKKLIDILKGLNFQVLLIYQNYDLEEKNINLIKLERKGNESKIK